MHEHLLVGPQADWICIAGPEDMPLCHYRLQGYVRALRRSGIVVDRITSPVATLPEAETKRITKQFSEQPLRLPPSFVIAT